MMRIEENEEDEFDRDISSMATTTQNTTNNKFNRNNNINNNSKALKV